MNGIRKLNLDELEKVSGGVSIGTRNVSLEEYWNCFLSLGLREEALRIENSQGKQACVSYICDSMTRFAPVEISAWNKSYAQKVWGMI